MQRRNGDMQGLQAIGSFRNLHVFLTSDRELSGLERRQMMKCPECRGTGEMLIFSKDNPTIECDVCHGFGILPANIEYLPQKGKQMREDRISTNLTLRRYCLKTKIDIFERALQERGYFIKEVSA